MKKILLLFLLINCALWSNAQDWEAGAWLGGTYYFGDISPDYKFDKPQIGIGAVARINFNPRLALKISGSYGMINGEDRNAAEDFQLQRNLSFRSRIFDGTAQFEFNFLKYVHGSKDDNFTPYIFGGVSLFSFNPETEYNGEWVALQPLGTEGQFRGNEYSLIQPALAYGFGVKFDITPVWSLNIEASGRRLQTDYLDDVSTTYTDMEDLLESRGPIAVALSDRSIGQVLSEPGRQRGDSKGNDMYMFVGITLAYSFLNVKCFTFY